MSQRRNVRRRWCSRILKVAAGLIVLAVLGFLLLQLLLMTPWLRGKVAGKVSQRMGGLEVSIAELKWTPWSGATVGGLEVKQPESLRELVSGPLLEVEEIHAWPDYLAAMKGKARVSEVTVRRPNLHVTVEMLVSIAAASAPPAEPPVVAKVVPAPAVGPVMTPVPPADQPMVGEVAKNDESPVVENPVAPPVAPETEEPEVPPTPKVMRPRMRVVVEDGGFELVKAGVKERLAAVEGVKLDVPFFGEAGESVNRVALIECLGQTLDEDVEIKARTEGVGVVFVFPRDPKVEFGVFGSCQFGVVQGLPVQVDLGLRLPKAEPMAISKMLSGECGEVQARAQGGGWLRFPGSWRGVAGAEAMQVTGRVAGQAVMFDSGSAVVQLAGGVVQSPDFRLIGDSASVLGNGWVTSRDGAAVVRFVVPESVARMANGGLNKQLPESKFAFKSLEPGNRVYSDVSIWRGELGWRVEFGDGGTVVGLEELLGK